MALHRRSPGGGRHPDQYLLDPRQCRAAHLGPSGRAAGAAPPAGGAHRHHRLHGRAVEGASDRRRGCRGYCSGTRRLPRPAEAGARSRCGRQGDQRPAVARGDLRRDRTRAARPQRRERLRGHHARLQQLLLLLRGALHAGHRTQPRSRDDPRGGAVALRQRLPRGDAAGAERQLLPCRRGRFSGADPPCGRRLAAAARALRHVAPQGHERRAVGSDGVASQHLPGDPPARPVGFDRDAAPHESQVYARVVPRPRGGPTAP